MSTNTNQGAFGTCVGHSFAKALTDGLLGKYAVPVDVHDIVSAVERECDCWEGKHLVPMCDAWNEKFQDKWFKDIDKKCRYRIKVDYKRLDTIEEAYAHMQKVDGVLLMMVAIDTDETGHSKHALAVDKPYKKVNEMRGLNSWGASQAFMEVTAENFNYAVTVEPVILEKKQGKNLSELPSLTRSFSDMEVEVVQQDDNNEAEIKKIEDTINVLLVQKKQAIVEEEFVEAQRLKEMIAGLVAKKEALSEKQNGETKDVS